jgi:hypothetical protein
MFLERVVRKVGVWVFAIAFSALLAACGGTQAVPTSTLVTEPVNQPAAGVTPSAKAATRIENNGSCAYTWATESLPEESAKLQTVFDKVELSGYQVKAEAYGENCVAGDGTIVSFGTMETDIYVTVAVPNVQDHQDLGNRLGALMQVLDHIDFQLPGPNAGYLGVTFQQGDQAIKLWAPRDSISRAISNGLSGMQLFDEIQNH